MVRQVFHRRKIRNKNGIGQSEYTGKSIRGSLSNNQNGDFCQQEAYELKTSYSFVCSGQTLTNQFETSTKTSKLQQT